MTILVAVATGRYEASEILYVGTDQARALAVPADTIEVWRDGQRVEEHRRDRDRAGILPQWAGFPPLPARCPLCDNRRVVRRDSDEYVVDDATVPCPECVEESDE